jgi:hypothetical protein
MKIKVLKAGLQFESDGTYPVGITANEEELRDYMKVYLVAATILQECKEQTEDTLSGCKTLNQASEGLNNYLLFKSQQPVTEIPYEITRSFFTFPLERCSVFFQFQPYNNVSTEMLFYSWDEIRWINNALSLAKSIVIENCKNPDLSEADLINYTEMGNIIENLVVSFSDFVASYPNEVPLKI